MPRRTLVPRQKALNPIDDLATALRHPDQFHNHFYIGQECPHGHHWRHRQDHWCFFCAMKIAANRCGADLNRVSLDHRWIYWPVLKDLPTDLDPTTCWLLPASRRSDNANRPVFTTYTYRTHHTKKSESILLSRFIYYWFWGDTGSLTVKRLCNNQICWNPLHVKTRFNDKPMPTKLDPFDLTIDVDRAVEFAKQKPNQDPAKLLQYAMIKHPKLNANIQTPNRFRPLEEKTPELE